ncbi:ABC transporter permease [Methylocapsa acidiphila]|uniref:ABC transporter permease n=1 Tax=Methylocapsa acidiphila TaxID=133552 RepID=UPI0004246189|nr:ABC transporter permease [Methylocapsa acidiphila]
MSLARFPRLQRAGAWAAPLRAAAAGAATPSLKKLAGRWLLRLASLLVFTAAWQYASSTRLHLGFVTFANVPSPADVFSSFVTLAGSGKLLPHLGSSLARVFLGYALAAVVGVALGLAIARARLAEDLLMPPLELLRPIPAVAWIPLAILMFPSAEASMVFITFIGALFPILLNAILGVAGIDSRLIASARSLGAKDRDILFEVVIPGAAPSILTGLAIGMGTSWFCLVTAEMISGQFGVGYYTWEAYTLQNYADIVVGMLVIGVLGMSSSAAVRQIGRALTPWQAPN